MALNEKQTDFLTLLLGILYVAAGDKIKTEEQANKLAKETIEQLNKMAS